MMKLIAFDLDGTLAPKGGATPSDCQKMLLELEQMGIRIAICSGKPAYYLCGFARQLGLSDPVLIGENGAVMQYSTDVPPKAYHVLEYSDKAKEEISFFRNEFEKALPHIWYQPNIVGLTPFFSKDGDEDKLQKIIDSHPQMHSDIIIYRHCDCFDLTPVGITKYDGLKAMCEYFGMDRSEICAVGDGVNDYSMFEFAGASIGINIPDSSKVTYNCTSLHEALNTLLSLNK